ncbi:hybrid sensor histidine kinase/response regulator [Lysinibacillus piscis]|uniref:histidine kinase n=1 Tax=Lysinibacillus piscis TaxID=2518931 RepID=A0ABQ5NPV3_9BACI|nr:ATP-binding protein [Lysinibacillus sp. KH24]GLC90141.1 hypothetical protein LYSBPC_32680 [Lysinibacillus sp. KH24]
MNVPEGAEIQNGTLYLDTQDTSKDFKIQLNGEWAFYSNTLIATEENPIEPSIYANLPEAWNHYFSNQDEILIGSYRLTIMHNDSPQMYGLTIPEGLSPYELYVNGKLIGGIGKLAFDTEENAPIDRVATYYFPLHKGKNDIIIQGQQSNHYIQGGFRKTIVLGDLHSIEQYKSFSVITQLLVCVIFLFYLLFTIILFIIGIRSKSLFYFTLTLITTILTVIVSSNKLLFVYFPTNWIIEQKLSFLAYILTMIFLMLFFKELVKEYTKSKAIMVLLWLCSLYALFIVLAPIQYVYQFSKITSVLYIVTPIAITLHMTVRIKEQKGMLFLVLTGVAIIDNSLFYIEKQNLSLPYSHYPIGILAAITMLSAFEFTRYFQATIQTQQLSIKLQKEIATKDDFLANTSHELRNPLHGMMSITQAMLNKQENKDLRLLLSIGNHMSHVLDDLLDLVQLKEKTLRLYPKALNLHSLANSIHTILLFRLKNKPIKLIINVPENTPLVWADETRVIQIFTNLIYNAIKFTEEGSITVTVERKDAMLYISVTDTGVGIDKKLQERIFEPYEQADASMTAIGGGLGLGLSICRDLVTLHGGTLSLLSEVGKGSTFTFSLPIADNQVITTTDIIAPDSLRKFQTDFSSFEKEVAITEQDSLITSQPHILIVDDDPVNLQVLVNAMSSESYHIDTATSGAAALDKIQAGSFDLVISDIMMPYMSGYELAQHIREQFSIAELPILFLTARQQREDIHLAFSSGANDYVKKPMDLTEFTARIQALVRMKLSGEERLRIEAAWLQAQIQPHFFFNTLNSIISLHGVDDEQMEELLLAFSDYLQMSFDFQNVDLVVPIDYELKLVRSYLTIEQIRFGDRIQVMWDLPDNFDLHVPPLVIQTLVENAIQHGILPRKEGGIITIRITESTEAYTVAIIDNGVGFDTTKPRKQTSVGLVNTEQRLRQIFGSELIVESQVGYGTTIAFAIAKK